MRDLRVPGTGVPRIPGYPGTRYPGISILWLMTSYVFVRDLLKFATAPVPAWVSPIAPGVAIPSRSELQYNSQIVEA
eukprot:639211-Rhodomonas_salina.3